MLFQDPQLDALEARSGSANQNLKAAFARLREARAATRIARGRSLSPHSVWGASAARARAPRRTRPDFAPDRNRLSTISIWEADLSYEVDLWESGTQHRECREGQQPKRAPQTWRAWILRCMPSWPTDYYTLRSQDAEQVLAREDRRGLFEVSAVDAAFVPKAAQRRVADVDQAQAQLETGADAGGRHCPGTRPKPSTRSPC